MNVQYGPSIVVRDNKTAAPLVMRRLPELVDLAARYGVAAEVVECSRLSQRAVGLPVRVDNDLCILIRAGLSEHEKILTCLHEIRHLQLGEVQEFSDFLNRWVGVLAYENRPIDEAAVEAWAIGELGRAARSVTLSVEVCPGAYWQRALEKLGS
jgi:hypothetical protein